MVRMGCRRGRRQDLAMVRKDEMNGRALLLVLALGAWAVGCSEREERQVSAKEEFEIPLTLVQRMMEAHDKAYSNALEVVTQPRGEMRFADDGLDEAGRTRIWPFDLESYEKELEGQMARDTNGLYRLLGKFAEGCPTDDDGLVAGGLSIRLVNLAIEAWATNQLDRIAPRMSEADYCAMFRCMGCEAMPEGTWAWEVRKDMYLVVRWVDDGLTMREYMFIQWKGAGDPYPVAMFDTFPNKKEAVAALLFKDDAAAINNLAVMMWRHQCDGSSMDALAIKSFLETARKHRVPFAAENLAVLRRCVPEVFIKKADGPLCRSGRRVRLPRRRAR